jgi:hypothetical protein
LAAGWIRASTAVASEMAPLRCSVCGRDDCPLEQENGVWYPRCYLDAEGRVHHGKLITEQEGVAMPLEEGRDK